MRRSPGPACAMPLFAYIFLVVTMTSACRQSMAQTDRDSLYALLTEDLDSTQWNLRIDLSSSLIYSSPDSALQLLVDALKIAQEIESEHMVAKTLSDLAVTFFYKAEYEKSLENHLASLQISQQNQFLDLASTTLGNIGILYTERKDHPKAIRYYRESFELKKNLHDSMGVARALNNIGMSYYNMKNLDSAEHFYIHALDMARSLKARYGEGLLLNNLGSIYMEREEYEQALKYYHQALSVKEEIDDVKGMSMVCNNIGNTYLSKSEPDVALEWFEKGLTLALRSSNRSNEAESLKGLYQAFEQKGIYKEAMDFLTRFKDLSDTLQKEMYSEQIGELETRYETKKKEAEISRLQTANELAATKQKNLNLVFSLLILGVLSLSIIVFMRLRYLQQRRAANIEKERVEELSRINIATSRFVPTDFLGALGKDHIIEVNLGDFTEREVTVFFSDIRNFTSLAEKYGPGETFKFIQNYSRLVGPTVRNFNGFINNYVGDGVLALFPNSSVDGLKAAIAMQRDIAEYNLEQVARGESPLQVGIGLHTGSLIMGIVGDEERYDPAIISDTVNTVARLEALTKHFGANILMTETGVPNGPKDNGIGIGSNLSGAGEFGIRYLGKVLVKGKTKPMGIYECYDGDSPTVRDKKRETVGLFNEALDRYFSTDFATAASSFGKITAYNPEDQAAVFFRIKSDAYSKGSIPVDWRGIEVMYEK